MSGTKSVGAMLADASFPDKSAFSTAVLRWYDAHARDLPWRIGPADRARGVRPDPYRVWLSEVMLQQTTVATVTPRFTRFLERWPDVGALAGAPLDDVLGEWAGLGYYARARNLHACAVAVATEHGGKFPEDEEGLKALPGIGPYTAAAIAAIAFDRPATVIDGNIERIMVRIGRIARPIREAKSEIAALAEALTPRLPAGDYAQGLMDLGATVCRPKAPACDLCPVTAFCAAYDAGVQDELPVKPQKMVRPERAGTVFVGIGTDGAILTERRPAKGLFGGMRGLPGSAWTEGPPPEPAPPTDAAWRLVGAITHTLTHFRLTLEVRTAQVPVTPDGLFWTPADEVARFPTVFRKAIAVARDAPAGGPDEA